MSDHTGKLDADKMDLMLLLRDQRNALCSIAQAFGWDREDWSIPRLIAEATRLKQLELETIHNRDCHAGGEKHMVTSSGVCVWCKRKVAEWEE
jgi:hypothetical protein